MTGRVTHRGWRSAAIVLSSVTVTLLATAPAHAFSLSRAFSDTNSAPSPTIALAALRAQTSVCRVPRPRHPRIPRLRGALQIADRLLAARTSHRKFGRLVAQGSTQNAGNVLGLAGVAQGQPGVALVGFLAAHARVPDDPLPLLDAGVMLSSLGHQPEALSLLARAARLPARGEPPGDVSLRALIDNARGVALFRIGQFAAAEAAFRSALARQSDLSAARRNLAAALLCRGRTAQAVQPYIDSTYVDPVQSQSGGQSGSQVPPVPGSALDLSHGIPGTLPKLTIPPTADDGAASYDDINAASDRAFATGDQAYQDGQQALKQLSAEQGRLGVQGVGELIVKREDSILAIWNNWQTNQPQLGALYDKVQSDHSSMEDLSPSSALDQQVQDAEHSCSGQPTQAQVKQCLHDQCWPVVQAGHADWLPLMKGYDADVRAFAGAIYQYATALAKNTASPALAATMIDSARQLMYGAYFGELANALDTMTFYEQIKASECYASSSGSAAGDDANTASTPAAPCPPEVEALKISIKFADIFELKVNCDSVELGVSDGTPISPYASFKYKFFDGSMSAFVGVKGGYKLENGDLNLSVKGGMYMNWDASGNPTDVGIKVSGPGISAKGFDNVGLSTQVTRDATVSLAPILLN